MVVTFGMVLAVCCLINPGNGLPHDAQNQASEKQELRGWDCSSGECEWDYDRKKRGQDLETEKQELRGWDCSSGECEWDYDRKKRSENPMNGKSSIAFHI